VIALAVLAPLGFILGMFMPLGLGAVAGLSRHPDEYVAWGWAVNGFFSVIGSVLTTILSMSFGFRTVQFVAFGIYVVAALSFTRLSAIARRTVVVPEEEPPPEPLPEPAVSTT
jgi:MFS family permease